MLAVYSALLTAVLVVGAPYWLVRMATSGRYRKGLGQRLGRVPAELRAAVGSPSGARQVVWVHAVSVGEVLAATRLVGELETALGDEWVIVISTTTATGQALAQERFGAGRVFFYPLDFAWAVRAYLRALRPRMLVLMESELWPRMLAECREARIPVAVVNARVSDRSYARGMRVRWVWGLVLRMVSLYLAQSEEDARRLEGMGARASTVHAIGNLKYDALAPKASRVAELIREAAAGRPIVVAGSTVDRKSKNEPNEDEMVIQAWEGELRNRVGALLVLAPRHPERFGEVESQVKKFSYVLASELAAAPEGTPPVVHQPEGANAVVGDPENSVDGLLDSAHDGKVRIEIVLLDTIGDLAAVYGVANVAFVGGSLVQRGGHNPLEPAQFGVPIVMGPSFENFRGVVGNMVDAYAIRIVQSSDELDVAMFSLLTDREAAKVMGERGRAVFAGQQGATRRAVAALVAMVRL